MKGKRAVEAGIVFFGIVCLLFLPPAAAGDKTVLRDRARRLAKVGNYPPRAWEDALVFENSLYKVTTNTSEEVAKYICLLMSFAQKTYRSIFCFDEETPQFQVYAFRTYAEYEEGLRKIGLSSHPGFRSSGLFVEHKGLSCIYLPYERVPTNDSRPTCVLLHEGTHQFARMGLDFKVPEADRDRLQGRPLTLPSTPRWLNEGLADYLETSFYNGEKLIVGHINRSNLMQLQAEIKAGKSIPFSKLFRASDEQFNTSYYAAAWGVVYWFIHSSDTELQAKRREYFRAYLCCVRKGFMENPETEFSTRFFKKGRNFAQTWESYEKREGYNALLRVMFGEKATGKDLEEWEKGWKQWVLSLNPKDNYGGLYPDYYGF
ncbi:MAG: DUF1570 domain-containing protein [Planctomycetota bacterium]